MNEKGIDAAALTLIGFRETSISITAEFYVDRPFAFALEENNTNALKFSGNVIVIAAEQFINRLYCDI